MYRRFFLLHPMFDENAGGAAPAGSGDAGAAGGAAGAAGGGNGGSTQEPVISAEELQQLRDQLKTLQDTETERQTAVTTAQTALRNERGERSIENEARALKLDPKLALRLLPANALEYDEQGQPKNVRAALESLATEFPNLKVAVAAAATSSTSPTNPARTTPKLTKDDIKKMTPAEINARWDEVQQVLAS